MLVALGAVMASAQEYNPPESTPPTDFQVQGEYFGTVVDGGGNLGAWVIGQGGDKYNVVFLPGGLLTLPDDKSGGWDKVTRISGTGTAAALTTSSGYMAAITGTGDDRTMTGTNAAGKAFTLKRVLRKSPTQGLDPKPGLNAAHLFRANTQADLLNWDNRGSTPQMRYGGFLYRGVTSKATLGTVFLHIEVRSPYCPTCRGQDRGNSGIYLRGMHEMQVLDSFGLAGSDNELGAIYRVKAPLTNAALPPLTWQTYDCYYTPGSAPNSATMTVYLNGVLVQDKTLVTGITEAGYAGNILYLQDHGPNVVYNNIWMVANATEASLPYATLLPSTGTGLAAARTSQGAAAPRVSGAFSRPGSAAFFDALGRNGLPSRAKPTSGKDR